MTERSYNDACGTAHALDLIGERWALLVMRELLLGPRRFGDLRGGLPGISANVLTQRLEGLEASGVVARRKLPPPASVQVYELTDWGREAEPIIQGLGRWGARSPLQNLTAPLSATGMMVSFRSMFVADRALDETIEVALRLDGYDYWMRIEHGIAEQGRGALPSPDLTIAGSPGVIAGAVYGFVARSELEASGALQVEGAPGAFERFSRLFQLPDKTSGSWV